MLETFHKMITYALFLCQQIQERCGDSSMQLPHWSANADKEIIRDTSDSYPGSAETSGKKNSANESTRIIESENLAHTIYENGFERTHETSTDFDQNDNVFEENGLQHKNKMHSGNAQENIEQQLPQSSQRLEKDKFLREEEKNKPSTLHSDFPEETENQQVKSNSNRIAETRKEEEDDILARETRSENSRVIMDKPSQKRGDLDMADSKNGFEQKSVNSHKGDTGVRLFLNVSNFNSDESDEEVSRVCSRHVLEPVEERVTIEVMQTRSGRDSGVSQKETEQIRDPSAAEDSTSDTEETPSKTNVKTMNWDPVSCITSNLFSMLKALIALYNIDVHLFILTLFSV